MGSEKIAVIGGGPAGMTISDDLREEGFEVHIYEKRESIGGLWIYGLPDWRMDKSNIEKRIEELKEANVKIHTKVNVGKDIKLGELIEDFDAVVIATGAWEPWMPSWEGKDLPSVFHGFNYLIKRNLYKMGYIPEEETLKAEGRTYVIGGGNTAMDAAREAIREGADVHILYRRSKELMPCSSAELRDTKEEGVKFHFLRNVKRFIGEEDLEGIEVVKMKLGEPDESGRPKPIAIEGSEFKIEANTAIAAIGQSPTPPFDEKQYGIKTTEWGRIKTDDKWRTSREGIFAIGDVATGPKDFSTAIRGGIQCANSVKEYLKTGKWGVKIKEEKKEE